MKLMRFHQIVVARKYVHKLKEKFNKEMIAIAFEEVNNAVMEIKNIVVCVKIF